LAIQLSLQKQQLRIRQPCPSLPRLETFNLRLSLLHLQLKRTQLLRGRCRLKLQLLLECRRSSVPIPHALSGSSFVDGAGVTPLAPFALPVFSRSWRNGLTMSIGIGKTTVEFCSAPISVSVCK
jgi:hypothetical protein